MQDLDYRPRIVDSALEEYLQIFGAVCVEGPKWCGKTRTSKVHSNSVFELADPAGNFNNRHLAEVNCAEVLLGSNPLLLDEWQEVPLLWDAVRFEVDRRGGASGQFILTGSATPRRKGILHSGAGRIGLLRMRTMSLFESGDSTGEISLRQICDNQPLKSPIRRVELKHLAELVVRGGWPGILGKSLRSAQILTKEYIKAVLEEDIQKLEGVERNPHKMELLLRSLARNESTMASNATLRNDIKTEDKEEISAESVAVYLDVFRRMFLTDNQRAFSPKIRSSVRVKQGEKLHLADPSLACALLGFSPQGLINDLSTFGFLFEALCERDLRVYASLFDGELYHYRDYKGKEIDAILQLEDNEWVAFEIKLGANKIEEAEQNLLSLREAIIKDGQKPPKSMCIICGLADMAYTLPSGVHVVPITMLGV